MGYPLPKRDHRVSAGGAARRDVTGEQRDEREREGDEEEGGQIERAHFVKRRNAGREVLRSATIKPRTRAGADERSGMRNDEAENIGALRAERHAHPDFVRPLHDEERHHAVDADRGEDEREPGEDRQEHDRKPARRDRIGNHLFERAHVRNRLRRIDRLHFAPDGAR